MKNILITTLTLTGILFTVAVASAEDGKAVYTASCVKCHGEGGAGKTKMGEKLGARDYSQKATWSEITDQRAIQSILQGLKKNDKVLMKPFSDLSVEAAQASITYMRTLSK